MPRGDDVRITEIPSARWDLAIECLERGGPMALLDTEPPVGLQREVGWPTADGKIHVSIFTTTEPHDITNSAAAVHASTGLSHLRAAIDADPRFAALLERHGVAVSYIYDYGHGGACVGDIDLDGTVHLI